MSATEDRPALPWRTLVLVGLGGALGVLARDGLGFAGSPFAVITAINIAGSFALGLLAGLATGTSSERWAIPLLGTGFLGGFTTLSAVTVVLAGGPGLPDLALAGAQVVFGTGLALLGLLLADRVREASR
ncbi:FluC/FEX family fluoride channel [Naumannella halotolerans]|uniref:Fluoride-specific ion channel FluC n=1 Tax=Naumannella halotolerans TaxID=993414 RepID=A0A4R7IYZ3_9ACTN|nr:CrcB family protein [Naumannella halotolerans]TDT29925.1 CrcB protein [Naumannella halotolerans]